MKGGSCHLIHMTAAHLWCGFNKQKQRFPATTGIAFSSFCGYKGTDCKVSPLQFMFSPPLVDKTEKLMALLKILR